LPNSAAQRSSSYGRTASVLFRQTVGSRIRIKQAKLTLKSTPPISPINDIDNQIAYQNHFSNRQSGTHILFLFSKTASDE